MPEPEDSIHESDVSMREILNEVAELEKQKKEVLKKRRFLLKKRKSISDQIRDRAISARSLRGQRDAVVSKVKESKEKRQETVSKIKENIAKIKELRGELKSIEGARSTKFLKKKIKALEWSFQTEPRGLEKEKKLLKKIDDLKDELKLSQRRDDILSEMKEIDAENFELKKEQEAYHLSVVSKAKDSNEAHEEFKVVLDRINDFKKKLKPIDENLDGTREKLSEIKNEISEKRLKIKAIKSKIDEKRRGEDEIKLKKKMREVEKKLANGEKLNTEDILVLQASEGDSQASGDTLSAAEEEV